MRCQAEGMVRTEIMLCARAGGCHPSGTEGPLPTEPGTHSGLCTAERSLKHF